MYGYKNYSFRDKDPAIAVLRGGISLVAAAMGVPESFVRKKMCSDIRMNQSTLYAWFAGPTRMPRHAGIEAVADWLLGHVSEEKLGYKSNVVKLKDFKPKKPKLKRVA